MFNMAYNTSDINANICLLKYVPDTKTYKLNKSHIVSSIDDYNNNHIKDKITLLMNDVKELEMICYVKLLDLLKKE